MRLRKRRRRGSRGGRGRKKPGAPPSTGPRNEAAAPRRSQRRRPTLREQPAQGAARRAADGRGGGTASAVRAAQSGGNARRKQPPRRAPLPAAKRELLISVDIGEQRVAVIEDDRSPRSTSSGPSGARSPATSTSVSSTTSCPGMEAAFVEIGLEKNGFLYVDEIVVPELEGKRHGKKIQDLISRGEQLLVQAVKDPMKTKGARLTTEISLPGPLPRLRPERRGARRLAPARGCRAPASQGHHQGARRQGWRHHRPHRGRGRVRRGRRARPRLPAAALEHDPGPREDRRPRRRSCTRRRSCRCGSCAISSPATSSRRTIDHERTHKRIVGYLKKTSPHMIERVHRYKEKTPLFEEHGVDREIELDARAGASTFRPAATSSSTTPRRSP